MYMEIYTASLRTLLRALSDACERYATAYAGKSEKMQVPRNILDLYPL